jgi:anti-sigma B factor antagonist
MSKVAFLDSSGLGALVAAMKQMSASRQLELACLSDAVHKVFRLTRMDSVFRVHNKVEDAFAAHCNDM